MQGTAPVSSMSWKDPCPSLAPTALLLSQQWPDALGSKAAHVVVAVDVDGQAERVAVHTPRGEVESVCAKIFVFPVFFKSISFLPPTAKNPWKTSST